MISVSEMMEEDTIHCLLTKLCQCLIHLSQKKEYQQEEIIVSFLARLFSYNESQFKLYFENIKKNFQPVATAEKPWWEGVVQPIVRIH